MLYLERLDFPLILWNNKWKLACLELHNPTPSPWEHSGIKSLMGKLKLKDKNRGVRREMCARKGFYQVFAFNTKIFWSSSVWAKCWNSFQLRFLRVSKPCALCSPKAGGPGCLASQVRLLQSCINANLWILLGEEGENSTEASPPPLWFIIVPLVQNALFPGDWFAGHCDQQCFAVTTQSSPEPGPGQVVPKDKPPLLILNVLE